MQGYGGTSAAVPPGYSTRAGLNLTAMTHTPFQCALFLNRKSCFLALLNIMRNDSVVFHLAQFVTIVADTDKNHHVSLIN